MSNTKVSVILQARTSSTRLPGKVLKELSGRSMLEFQVERIRRCDDVENIILATSTDSDDDVLASLGESLGIIVVRGPLDDVLSRFILATEAVQSETFIRITGDCPFVDPSLMSEMIHQFNQDKLDYLTNACPPTYPDGLDIEIFSRQSLCLAHQNCSSTDQREHVTPWIRESGELKVCNKVFDQDLSHIRLTVDEPEDLALIRSIVDYFQGTSTFLLSDIIDLLRDNPGLFSINKQYKRNEGATLSSGQKLWRRAKRVIPGGNMLLSKRPDMFLPSRWPSYFSSAKGCIVTDLDGKEYIDMSIMGIGTNILGYGNEQVDETVLEVIQKGNMSTLNCPEEVYLAERLVEIHPWADMARFARSGGEANAIAIRIARAATGREKIAICGYHGWHDWYLASNLNDSSSLNEHLLPGLSPDGVPKSLAGTTIPFNFNDIKRLKEIIRDNDLAAIKMEVQRNVPPLPGFLEEIRALCFKNNIVLIFDECTSGFRETFGGHHLTYGVMPDLAMFGKTLGNGYAITSVIGRRSVMEAAQTSFISSTFWTERIGPAAALKTLEVMESMSSWSYVSNLGSLIRKSLHKLASRYDLNITFAGLLPLTSFSFGSQNDLIYKTLITQEMLKKGFLASNSIYASTAHNEEYIEQYLNAIDTVFEVIGKCEKGVISSSELLEVPVCSSGFSRLN